ncbi:MAG: hypothetical protein ACM3PU_14420 [Gemmatimonadota bacterium]
MNPAIEKCLKVLPALGVAVACIQAHAGQLAAVNTASQAVPVTREVPPPPGINAWSEELPASLPPVTIEGRRIPRPDLHQVFEQNLARNDTIEFASIDRGDGRRCTSVQPFGYEACTHAATKFVVRAGSAQ